VSAWAEAIWWCAAALGLTGTALYAGMETGLYFINRVKLEVRAERGPMRRAAARLRRELEHPERVLATNLVGTVVFSDLAAQGASALLHAWGYSESAGIAINVLVLTPLVFVFGETVPKELFRLEADRLTYTFSSALGVTRRVLAASGVLWLVHELVTGLSRLIGGEGEAGLAMSARERIATMLKESAATGALSESQAGMVDRALAYQRMTAGGAMTPWPRIRSVPADWTRDQLVRLLMREALPVLPVVERGGGSRVVGMLRLEDVFLRAGGTAAALAREAVRIPARMRLPEAAAAMRDAGALAGVVEEGGRTVGVVLLEDALAPLLVG
jgi:CBS domain containing-hemolysin-like protein